MIYDTVTLVQCLVAVGATLVWFLTEKGENMLFRNPETEEELETYSYFEDNDTMSHYEMLEHLLYRGFVEVFVQGRWHEWEITMLDYQPHVRVDEAFTCAHPDEWLYTPLDELTE